MAGQSNWTAIRSIPPAAARTDTFAQASVLDLYDPFRSPPFSAPRKIGRRARSLTHTSTNCATALNGTVATDWRFLVEEVHSPTRERLRSRTRESIPENVLVRLRTGARATHRVMPPASAFGENKRLIPLLERADVVLALDSDFLDCGEGDLAACAAFTSRRRVTSCEGHDEPALRGGESVHAHRFDGRSSFAVCGQSDSDACLCAGCERLPSITNDAGLDLITWIAARAFRQPRDSTIAG